MQLEIGTVLVQWAAGGLAFLWVTTRRRVVGPGYGWLLRSTYVSLAALGVAAAVAGGDPDPTFVAGSLALVAATGGALAVSVVRRGTPVADARRARRRARVAAMLDTESRDRLDPEASAAPEFPPVVDLVAPVAGLVALAGAAAADGGPYVQSLVRLVTGGAFLGAVTDAMLLGHWYLVQPGLSREPLSELVRWCAYIWPVEVAALLWPTGMLQVLSGTVDDGYDGLLGWIWLACAVATIALVAVTALALRERYYSAVMAATGLLYLAILTAFGTDLIARAVLAP